MPRMDKFLNLKYPNMHSQPHGAHRPAACEAVKATTVH
jgi:hypothetical protein